MANKGQRLNPFEHALIRPDTYIGSINNVEKEVWIYNTETKLMEMKTIQYNPGLYNIIREIGSNCIDNKWRSERTESTPMTKIKVDVSDDGTITFWNDGYSIPIELTDYTYTDHRTNKKIIERMYPAEMFFGDMLAGTNFDSDNCDEHKTSGKNGMGSKATNVFSVRFEVEHTSPENRKKFVQVYEDNATKRTKPEITSFKGKNGYTKISFLPDYERFAYPSKDNAGIDDVLKDIIRTYVIEMAMVTGLPVWYNEEKYVIQNVEKYARLFYPDKKQYKSILFTNAAGDECLLMERDYAEDGDIFSVGFVNGIRTDKGIHVQSWKNSIVGPLVKAYNAIKPKGGKNAVKLKTSAKLMSCYLSLFIRCEINKPTWDTQTKDVLNGRKDENGEKTTNIVVSKPNAAEIQAIMKWGFVNEMTEKLSLQHNVTLLQKEKITKKGDVIDPKYNPANNWKKEPKNCTIWFTEGDSAKALALAIIAHLPGGRDTNGVYALRGKTLNVSAHTREKIASNHEISMVQQIIGLDPSLDYTKIENQAKLNYWNVNFFTDADDDGIHIQSLLLNLFYTRFPSLWKLEGFKIQADSTYFAKIYKTTTAKEHFKVFYTMGDMIQWEKTKNTSGERIKLYKGLGSHESREAPELANNRKTITFIHLNNKDCKDAETMELAFGKGKGIENKRKEWMLGNGSENDCNFFSVPKFKYQGPITLSEHLNTKLLSFSRATLERAIPSIFDGKKQSQRKIFHTLRRLKLQNEKKVFQLSGAVADITAYEHGDSSLNGAIIKMATGYVGSNNIPLLQNKGMFGTRLDGGKDAAAPRYIFTCLDPITKSIFNKLDEPLLDYITEGADVLEPRFFVPIIPMVLVNGANGIATGFSTKVPQFNPIDLVKWIKSWINKKKTPKLVPWWRGFTGNVTRTTGKDGSEVITTEGIMKQELAPRSMKPTGWYTIEELPIGLWTNDFKDMCMNLTSTFKKVVRGKEVSQPAILKEVKDYSTENTVSFRIKPTKDFIPDIDTPKNPFSCLRSTMKISNMYLLNEQGYPIRFDTPEDIMEYFCTFRLGYYDKRKEKLLQTYRAELKQAKNKLLFVRYVVNKKLDMHQPDDKLEEAMLALKLEKIDNSFNYLLSMQMRSMTQNKMNELKKEYDKLKTEIETLKAKNNTDLWLEDLDKFEIEYKKFLSTRVEEAKKKKVK